MPRYNHGSRSGSALLLLSAREKWFPQTNFWEKRGGRLGASRRCLVIIIVLTFARMPPTNYDEPDRFERFSHTKRDTIRETSVLPRLEMYFRNGTIDYRNRSVLSLSIYIKREKSSRIYKSFHRPVFFSSPFFLPSRGRAARKTIKVGGRLERGVALSR